MATVGGGASGHWLAGVLGLPHDVDLRVKKPAYTDVEADGLERRVTVATVTMSALWGDLLNGPWRRGFVDAADDGGGGRPDSVAAAGPQQIVRRRRQDGSGVGVV